MDVDVTRLEASQCYATVSRRTDGGGYETSLCERPANRRDRGIPICAFHLRIAARSN